MPLGPAPAFGAHRSQADRKLREPHRSNILYKGILKDKRVDGGNVLTTRDHLPAYGGPKVVYAAG